MQRKPSIASYLPLSAVCVGVCMVIIDVTIVNVTMPVLAAQLKGGVSRLQWVVDGYTLTFACFLLSAGSFTDRFGPKNIFIFGLSLFLISSIFCSLAPNFLFLNISRLFQGLSASLITPSSLALINTVYTNHQNRSKAIAIWAATGGIAGAIGPVLGAVLTTYFGWRSAFLINIPIALIGIFLTKRYIKDSISYNKEGHFDIFGQIVSILMVTSLAFILIEVGKKSWSPPLVLVGLAIFVITLGTFLVIESRSNYPMLPTQLFKSKSFTTMIIIGMVINIGFYGELFILPIYFEVIKGYSILKTGLAILPIVIFGGLFSYFGGKIAAKFYPKTVIILGLSIGTLGFLAMLLITIMNFDSYFLLILPLLCIGFGMTFTMPGVTIAVIGLVSSNKSGVAAGTFNASRQIGSLIGVAIFGSAINATSSFNNGNIVALAIGAIIFLFGWLLALDL